MQLLDNISDRQNIAFGDAENVRLWRFQNTDNQYRYSCKITPNSTGKELDAETGFSYFGARYLDHTLITAWLSVDPMADKYPNISPYAYCAWNPVKLVDSDGMKFDENSLQYVEAFKAETNNLMSNNPQYYSVYQKALQELSELEESSQLYHIEINYTSTKYKGETSYDIMNNYVNISYDGNVENLAHELVHAYQFEKGELSFNESTGKSGVLYDLSDERNAYKRKTYYNLNFKMPSDEYILSMQPTLKEKKEALSIFDIDYFHKGEYPMIQMLHHEEAFSPKQIFRDNEHTFCANKVLD